MLAPRIARLTRIAPLLALAIFACRPKPVPRTEMPPRQTIGEWPCSPASFPPEVERATTTPTVSLREFYEPTPATPKAKQPAGVAKLGKLKAPQDPPSARPGEGMPAFDVSVLSVPDEDLLPRLAEPTRGAVARWRGLRAEAVTAQAARSVAARALDTCVAQSCGDASCIQLEGDRRKVVVDQLVLAIQAARAEVVASLSEREKLGPLAAADAFALELARMETALEPSDQNDAQLEASSRRFQDLARLMPSPDPLGWYALYLASQRHPNAEQALRLAEQLVDREAPPTLKAEAFFRLGELEATQRGSARAYEKAFAIFDKEKIVSPVAMVNACKLAIAVPPRELPETSLRTTTRCARDMAGDPSDLQKENTALARQIAEALQTIGEGSPALSEGIPTSMAGALAVAVGNEALGRFNLREAERAFKLALQYAPSSRDGGIALAGLRRIAEERGNVAEAASYATILEGSFGPAGSRPFADPVVPKAVPPTTEGANQDLTRRVLALAQKCLSEVEVPEKFRLRFRYDASKPKPASAELEDGVAKELAVCVAARAPRFFVDAPPMAVRAQIER